MRKLFSVLKYTRNYKGHLIANIVCNILFAVFNAVSLTLVAPFLKLLFEKGAEMKLALTILKGPPEFSWSHISQYINDISNYYLAGLVITQGGKLHALVAICIVVLAMVFLKNLFRYLAMFYIAPIRNGVVRDLRNKMYRKSIDLPLAYYSDEKKGDLMSRMTTDVQEIEWSIMQTLEMIFREPLTLIILVGTMIAISPMLTLYILCLLPVAALVIVGLGKGLKRVSRSAKETLGSLISSMEETLGGLKVIKAFNAGGFMNKKFTESNEKYFRQSISVYRKTDLSSPLTEVVVTAILILILFLGGKMVFQDKIDGTFFLMYFVLASQLIPPIKQLTTAYSNIQKGVASEERIDKILLADNVIYDKPDASELKGFSDSVRYNDVSFAYHKKGDVGYVLKNVSLEIKKGKMIALVGQSGSGKTTLADMLPRFYDCDKGEIQIDGKNIKDISITSLRKHIGVVTQESTLFNDTVAGNIAFGLENVSEEQIINAAKIANAHEFIAQLPQGYKTNIGDRGGKLSGGQKQRLSIARAVLRNPEILILDEATSALDTESEKLVQDALNNLMKQRTSIVIAHRLSTIMNADEIIVLSKGEIIERGTHAQLLALNGTYKKLCDMQSFK